MELTQFIEDKINTYAQKVIEGGAKVDEHALGEMTVYMCLRRVLSGRHTSQDVGMLDAINDTLQHLGIIDAKSTFYKR